jgi:hypothetical protein
MRLDQFDPGDHARNRRVAIEQAGGVREKSGRVLIVGIEEADVSTSRGL